MLNTGGRAISEEHLNKVKELYEKELYINTNKA
jgi:hypothetical protein